MLDRDAIDTLVRTVDLRPGRSHRHGLGTLGVRRVFVKACIDERRLPRIRNEWAWLCELFATRPGLGPEPLGYAEEIGNCRAVLVTGAVGEPARRLGEALRELHAGEIRSETIEFDGECWPDWSSFVVGSISAYVAGIRANGGELDDETERRLVEIAERFVHRYPRSRLAVVHGDPTYDNLVLDDSGRGRLIDFEVSHVGDPLFDLATARLLCMDGQTRAWEDFLDAYGLPRSVETSTRIWFYQVLRQLRLARGKVWIHGQPEMFRAAMQRVHALLADPGEVDLG